MKPIHGWTRAAQRVLAALALAVAFASPAGATPTPDDAGIDAATTALLAHAGERRLVLLGESHGTREIPDFVHALVARDSARRPVLLALEIPHPEQLSLDAYMRSDGGPVARAALRGRAFWQRDDEHHDGRRSEDMLDLVDDLRRLRADGRDVALLAYDIAPEAPRVDGDTRDRFMARIVRAAHDALPRGRVVVLGGNVHAMLARPSYAPAEMQVPMGAHLRDLDPASVRIGARGGQSWIMRDGRGQAIDADRIERNGAMAMPYTFGVSLDRFTVARLIGAAAPR